MALKIFGDERQYDDIRLLFTFIILKFYCIKFYCISLYFIVLHFIEILFYCIMAATFEESSH